MSWSLTYEVPPSTLSPDLHRPTECSTAVHPCGYCSAGQNALDFVILKVMLQRLDAHALGLKCAQRLREIPRKTVPNPASLPLGSWLGPPREDPRLNV